MDILILVDNGHGNNTAGKCSPDKRFREYAFNREIAAQVVHRLRKQGYNAELLVPELYDVPLIERVHRVNVKCQSRGKNNVILVSVHANAAGNGDWMNARGWCCFTTKGQTKSDKLADCMYDAAEKNFVGHKIRTDKSDGDRDWEYPFYICRHSLCAAVLVENFFMDNKEDLEYLESEEGKEAIVRCHVEGIISYIESL
jgi:N-acetylmuramoyl-L-alanine amidase